MRGGLATSGEAAAWDLPGCDGPILIAHGPLASSTNIPVLGYHASHHIFLSLTSQAQAQVRQAVGPQGFKLRSLFFLCVYSCACFQRRPSNALCHFTHAQIDLPDGSIWTPRPAALRARRILRSLASGTMSVGLLDTCGAWTRYSAIMLSSICKGKGLSRACCAQMLIHILSVPHPASDMRRAAARTRASPLQRSRGCWLGFAICDIKKHGACLHHRYPSLLIIPLA
jgi:hypothetical protein